MSPAVLKWIANGVIGMVVAGTLWMALAVQPRLHGPAAVLLAKASTAPAPAASGPVR
ncbi:MAG: hypothetical protein ACK4R2_11780 [Roseateles sp.]